MIPELSPTEYLVIAVACILACIVLAGWYWSYYQESHRRERINKFAKLQEGRQAAKNHE